MSSKRKHKTLLLKDKMDILKKLDTGETMQKLAKEYGVGRATIHDIKKKKQKIVDHVMMMESGPGKRKTLRVGDFPKMENALYKWFMQERSKHIPVSGEILRAKAKQLYKKITKKGNFRASDGWLDKFKKRFGIRLLTISVQEENLVEILEPPTSTTVRVKPETAFTCFNTCITWAEENGVTAEDIIILRNMREKVFKQGLRVVQEQTPIKVDYKS